MKNQQKVLATLKINNLLFIFVFQLSFIDCTLSEILGFDQLWTAFQQKLVTVNKKFVFFKMLSTFCRFTVQNCRYIYRV